MAPTKQNLFLFFQENEIQSYIDRRLVKLYMNRCIIDEDANFEIIGVYELMKVTDPMFNISNPLYKTNASQRTNKESVDRDIFGEALEKASKHETNSTDNHFIIGSAFHSVPSEDIRVISRMDKLLDWLFNEVKSRKMRSLYVTILCGHRNNLMTKDLHKKTYDGKGATHVTSYPVHSAREKPTTTPLQFSVNDDFELSIKLIRHGRRLQQNMTLFLHPMLNPYELKSESFLRSFTRHIAGLADKVHRATADVTEEELKRYPDSDPSIRYVSCFCGRSSYHLKPS